MTGLASRLAIGNIGSGNISTFAIFIKGLGRNCCAITKMDVMFIPSIMQRIRKT